VPLWQQVALGLQQSADFFLSPFAYTVAVEINTIPTIAKNAFFILLCFFVK